MKDESGHVIEVLAEYDPETCGAAIPRTAAVSRATIHWVDAETAVDAEVRLYDTLFTEPNPEAGEGDFLSWSIPLPLEILTGCKAETSPGGRSGALCLSVSPAGLFLRGQPGQLSGTPGVQPKCGIPEGRIQKRGEVRKTEATCLLPVFSCQYGGGGRFLCFIYMKALFLILRHHACRLSMDEHFPLGKGEPWGQRMYRRCPGLCGYDHMHDVAESERSSP